VNPTDWPPAPPDANVGLVGEPVMVNEHAAPAWLTV
jgi:hypothetical protein